MECRLCLIGDLGYRAGMNEKDRQRRHVRYTASAVLADGAIVETIRSPDGAETGFLVSRDGTVEATPTIDVSPKERLVPHAPTNNLLAHNIVGFPSDAAAYDSESGLVDEVRAFIHRYADLSEDFEEIAAYYVLLTWVYDAFNELPYLRFKGDYGTGKSRCLQTIGTLCYKPMFASGASTVSPLFRIIDAFRGTLIIDEGDFRFSDEKAEITKILNNGNAAGFPVLRSEVTPSKDFSPRAFTVFGPKIIATRRPFDDPALESRCLTESLTGLPPRPDIPLSLPAVFREEALRLRNQLLMYRFRQLAMPRDLSTIRSESLEPRVAQVMGPLLSVVPASRDAACVLAYARKLSLVHRSERDASVEAQLLDIMYSMRRDGETLGIKSIAEQFAARFGNDYERPITPRWIGAQLRRRLSLTAVKSHGTFVIPSTEGKKLEALFCRYGFLVPDPDNADKSAKP